MTDRMVTTPEYMELLRERGEWKQRALEAEAKVDKIMAQIQAEYDKLEEANMAFSRAAAEDAAMVERFNG